MGKFALLIGVSAYSEGLTNLSAAAQDVTALRQILGDPELGNFDEVQQLLNPSHGEMASTIELWIKARQKDDLILLFFSGHGVKDERRKLHFAACDTRKVDNQLIQSTAFAAQTLHDFLRYGRPKRQVIILDCCFSGAFGELLAKDDGVIELADQLAADGRVVLTSTSSVDYAFEEKKSELSIYTRYLVEGIEKGSADLNGDGFITVDELHKFASRKVREAAPAMIPEMITIKGQGHDIRVANAPQDSPELKYRRAVEKKAHRGQFTRPARRMLDAMRRQYGMTHELANAIETEVVKPFHDYQRKVDEYFEALTECLKDSSDLDKHSLVDLEDYQKYLGLKNEDVQPIQETLLNPDSPSLDSFKELKCSVECQIYDSESTILLIDNLLQLELRSISKYQAAKMPDIDTWVPAQLAPITQSILLGKEYADLVIDFHEISHAIKSCIEQATSEIGYSVEYIISTPRIDFLKELTRDFEISINKESFALRDSSISVCLEVYITLCINELKDVKHHIRPNVDIKKVIYKEIVNAIRQVLNKVESEEFHIDFPIADTWRRGKENSVEERLTQTIKSALQKKFHAQVSTISIRRLDTELDVCFRNLFVNQGSFEVIFKSLKDKKSVSLTGEFQVDGIVQSGWYTFNARRPSLEEVSQYVQKTLLAKLNIIPGEQLTHIDIETKERLEEVVSEIVSDTIAKQFGLTIRVKNVYRKLTEEEK